MKSQADKYEYGGRDGTTFVDMDQKFRWFNWDEVVKL